MTMAQLLALGAPKLREGDFYRVRSDQDGFVFVQIREVVEPSWRTFWRDSRLVVERRAPRSYDPSTDIREAAEACTKAITERGRERDYWDAVKTLEGDHR